MRNYLASESSFWHILDDISGPFVVPIVASCDLEIPANLVAAQASSREPPLRPVCCKKRVWGSKGGVYGATYGSVPGGAFWEQSRYACEHQCVNPSQDWAPDGPVLVPDIFRR